MSQTGNYKEALRYRRIKKFERITEKILKVVKKIWAISIVLVIIKFVIIWIK